jgi:parallel beta-helix repeat protein
MRIAFPWILLLLAALAAPAARAESSSCTVVASVPATLAAPGRYCLDQNWSLAITGGNAITITADDVDLDCNGHAIRTSAPAGNSAFGVVVSGAYQRARVRNCTVDGFDYGLYLTGGGGHRLQDNVLLRNGSFGIWMDGGDNLIEGNRFAGQRGGATIYPTALKMTNYPDRAAGNVIRGNTIADMRPEMPSNAGSAGMQLSYQEGTVIEDNVVTSVLSRTGNGTYGIITDHSSDLAVRGNTILSAMAPGVAPFDGGNYAAIYLQGTAGEQAGYICVDNVVGHFNGNITGCVQATNTGL